MNRDDAAGGIRADEPKFAAVAQLDTGEGGVNSFSAEAIASAITPLVDVDLAESSHPSHTGALKVGYAPFLGSFLRDQATWPGTSNIGFFANASISSADLWISHGICAHICEGTLGLARA